MTKKYSRMMSIILAVALVLGSLTVFANASAVTFTDVPKGTWFYDAVMTCADKGYVSGIGNNKFSPDGKLTYAQIFTMFTNAFYKAEKQDYENNRWMEMDAYFGGNPQWYSYNAFYFNDNGLLMGANVNIKSSASANAPITRYDVVQIANNILKSKGITVSDAQKREAQAKISDWSSIPEGYRPSVASCYYLGIISGYTGGRFGGTDTLTRAQACVILNALEKVVIAGPQTSVETPVTPDVPTAAGKLANGKDITEANVLELLAEVEKQYPTGTLWAERTVTGTAYNPNKVSSAVHSILESKYFVSDVYGCGGFAAMVSDLVFGQDNPCRKLDAISKIRPGDIIVIIKNNDVAHIQIAMSTPVNDTNKVRVADGNNNNEVVWPSNDLPHFSRPGNGNSTWEVYTRYPA